MKIDQEVIDGREFEYVLFLVVNSLSNNNFLIDWLCPQGQKIRNLIFA